MAHAHDSEPRPRLLERAPQLEELRVRIGEAVAGRGSMTLVLGEAGVGKTSLVRAAAAARSDAVRLLWGACDALSTPQPLAPLHDIAIETGGALAAAVAGDGPRFACFTALLTELAAPHPPTLVVIEDVHWADEATRDLLVFLARRVRATRAAVVVTARDDEPAQTLTSTLGRLVTIGGIRRLQVERLGPESVAALAGGVDAAELFALTAGNPFFVTEVVAARAQRVPTSVRDAVLARAATLHPAARHALDTTALVAEGAVPVDLVIGVTPASPDDVDECVAAGMLVSSRGHVSFRHELARRAVEDAVLPGRAAVTHRRLLAELERRGVDPARLAHHAERAGDVVRTARYALAAADGARRVGAHRSAARQYERALASGALADSAAATAWEQLARECSAFADDAGALRACEAARAIWRRLGSADDEGRALALLARVLWDRGHGSDAHETIREAIERFRDRPDSPAKAVALSIGALLLMLARQGDEAVELGWRAAGVAARTGDDRSLASALNAVGSSLWLLDPGAAQEPLVRSRDIAARLGDDISVASALINLGSGAGEIREYPTAERWLGEAGTWCAERDLDRSGGYATAWRARVRFERGDWPTAARLADSVRQDAGVTTRIVALTVLGRLHVRMGNPGADAPLGEAWALAAETGDLQRLWPAAAGRAEQAWAHGEAGRIPALVGETYELALRCRQPWAVGELGFWLWRAGELDVLPSGAAEPFAAHVRGEPARAAALWDELGCPYEAAVALADGEGDGALPRALQVLDRLGAAPAADAVVARLRAGGTPVPRRLSRSTAANPAGLTARELVVAHLLAQGLTDAEVGARLHITAKTAGHHTSAILAKLGVASRRDVGRAVAAAEAGES